MREVDNRGSNFYLALYWAEELAKKDATWQVKNETMFSCPWISSFHSALQPLAKQLAEAEEQVVKELLECQVCTSYSKVTISGRISIALECQDCNPLFPLSYQGTPVDVGGYFRPISDKVSKAMRPSTR